MTAQTLSVALGAAVLALGAIPAPVPAQEARSPSQVVNFADLNLDNAQGAEAMFGRIKSAAGEVCREEAISDLSAYHEWRACVRAATDTAVATLASPKVSALNEGHRANPVLLAKAR
jgi:UrcA family protein